jgi:hypothetical protein
MSQNKKFLEKLPPKTQGKKILMTLKNAQNIYNNYIGSSIEDYYDFMDKNDDFINEYKKIIENEEEEVNNKDNKIEKIEEKSKEMISDVDLMLKEIQELKSRIHDFKLKNKIKTRRDYLKYMNLIDNNNNNDNNSKINKDMCKTQKKFYNKLEKDFKRSNEEEKLSEYKKYIIPKESQKEKDYINIKQKLQKQEELIKKFENEKIDNEIKDNEVLNNPADIWNNSTGDEDVDKLLNEIKLADEKMDSYLKDIDECLELNENIEKQLDNEEIKKFDKEENNEL